MARLRGVKIVDMTAGEVTKVSYEGAEYVLTQEAPEVDDLIRTDGAWSGTVEEGNFYKCVDLDEDGDARIVTDLDNVTEHYRKHYEVFRKVSAQDPTLEARVGKLESDVAALKGEQGPTPKFKAGDKVRGKPNGEKLTLKERMPQYDGIHGLAWNTEEYSSDKWVGENQVELIEEKPLAVGDYAKVVPHNNDIGFGGSPGDIVIIRDKRVDRYRTKELSGGDYHGNPWVKTEGLVRATDEEVAEAKAALKVGDYAKVVGETYHGDFRKGTVVKIAKDVDGDGDYKIELLDGSDYDYAQVTSLEKVDADKATIIDKWAKIGRGVNEYREGDIVTLPGPFVLCSAGEVDSVGEVLVVRRFDGGFDTMHASKATLIAPVESRVDRN
ncbi:hypothetical protein M3626_20875 [Psychrobacillus sp. MER TA 17]|nr:hypothetical protein [Psychrobacillus sp. MER TA 17]